MSSAQEQIDVFLHSEPCVTSSWLAHTLRISARTAADALKTYKSKAGAEVHAKHLVTRRDAHGNYSLTVIDEEHLDSLLKDKSQSVLSCAIYSLEKTHSAATPTQIVSSSFELVESLLSSASSSAEGFLSNSAGEISLKGLTVQPVGERLLSRCNTAASVTSNANNNTTAAITTAAPSSIASLAKDPPKVVSVEKAASFFRKAATTTNTNTNTTNTTNTSTTAVTEEAIASSQASTQSESKYEPLQTKSGAEKEKKAKKTKLTKKSTKDDEDEEWDDGEPVVAKKKRGIAEKNLTDEEKEEEDKEEAAEESKPAKKAKAAKTVNVNVRGAMDEYMEDAAIEQAKAQAEQPQIEEGKKKKTKKVLVEKTFTDEKGYFVTETVWEEVTDNEADNVSAVKPQPKAVAVEEKKEEKKAATTASKGKKADSKPSGGVQKSMMSFFAKKT